LGFYHPKSRQSHVKNQRKNQKTISIKKNKKKKSKNQTHQSKTHQKKSKNKVVHAVGLGGRPDPSRLDPGQLWVYTMGLGGRPDPGQPDPGQLWVYTVGLQTHGISSS
jgi:hypothetical protein